MRLEHLPQDIEVFDVGARRLYVKLSKNTFAIFEDELTPDELLGIAQDIAARRSQTVLDDHVAASVA